jgi:hypothetical protein
MDFDALKDLVRIITRHKAKNIDLLGGNSKPGDLADQLYDGILKEKFTNDADAAAHFFGAKNRAKDSSFRKLKMQLTRQLINTTFFIDVDQPMFSDRIRASSSCYRDYAAAYLLIHRHDAKKVGLWLLEQILEQSIKFEFIALTADITRLLRMQYARTIGDSEVHEHYVNLNKKYEEMRRWETMASDYYEDLIRYYLSQRSPNAEVYAMASKYYDELLPLAAQVDISTFYYYTYQIGVIKCFAINDCAGAMEISDRALDILKSRSNTTKSALFMVALQKIACLIQLRIFDGQGKDVVKFCLQNVVEGDFNWFKLMEAHFHYCLHARRYEDAFQIFTRATKHDRYQLLTWNTRDDWRLYGGYLHLLALLGKLDAKQVEAAAGSLKLSKFYSDFMVLDKDKVGMNIPRMFFPVLYGLIEGTFWDSNLSTDALDKYRQRYLENELNRRSAIFMRLLIALAKKEFNPKLAEKRIQQELDEMKALPPELSRQTFAVEVIPYEDLWEMLTKKMS